jgi:hypothetical protein
MGGMNINPLLRFRFQPTAKDTAARKDESMWTIMVDNGQLDITAKWGGADRIPFHKNRLHSR